MRAKASYHFSSLTNRFRGLPRDYIARSRRSRRITNVVMITVLSFLLAAIIVYASNPGAFSAAAK